MGRAGRRRGAVQLDGGSRAGGAGASRRRGARGHRRAGGRRAGPAARGRRGSWLNVVPHLCEGTASWPTPAYLEAWCAPAQPEAQPGRLDASCGAPASPSRHRKRWFFRAFNLLPIKHGYFPIKDGRFPIEHGRFPIKHGRFRPGAIPVFVTLLRHSDPNLREQSMCVRVVVRSISMFVLFGAGGYDVWHGPRPGIELDPEWN